MQKTAFYIINGITLYRVLSAFVLFYLIISGNQDVFKWLLPVSFFTDLIDGVLARKYKVTSVTGSFLDSIGDDLTVLAGVSAMYFFKYEFLYEQRFILLSLLALFFIQIGVSVFRYRKISSFHTYCAKTAAILQGSFLILLYLLPQPFYFLFYLAALITFLDLIEEIVLVFVLQEWKVNVKGLYWILKQNREAHP